MLFSINNTKIIVTTKKPYIGLKREILVSFTSKVKNDK